MRGPRKEQDFQKFYFTYVAKGESCGCAERVIDIADFERKARERPVSRRIDLFGWARRALRRKTGA